MAEALRAFKETKDRPTFILVHSHIGYGSSKQDTNKAHGTPLGPEVIKAWKESFHVSPEAFFVPDGVRERFKEGVGARGKQLREAWYAKFEDYKKQFPTEGLQVDQILTRKLPEGWDKDLPTFPADPKGMAGRKASAKIINAIAKTVPWLIGGAADLNESTLTDLEGAPSFEPGSYGGRNFHFGIREHEMAAFLNGMALVKVPAVRIGLLHLQRLCPPLDPDLGHHGDPDDPRLHPRLDRRRRGRPDPPARRATGQPPGHPRPEADPPGRRQRVRRGLEGHHEPDPRARRLGPHPAGPPDVRPDQVRPGLRPGQGGPMSWPMPKTASPTSS